MFINAKKYLENAAVTAPEWSPDAAESTLGENFWATWDQTKTITTVSYDRFLGDRLESGLKRLYEITGDEDLNPAIQGNGLNAIEERRGLGHGGRRFTNSQLEAIYKRHEGLIRQQRAANVDGEPEIPTFEEAEADSKLKTQQIMETQARVAERAGWGGWAAGMAGGFAGAMVHEPVNWALMPFNPGGTALRRIIAQGLINAGSEAAIELGPAGEFRKQMGVPIEWDEFATNIGFAFGGGAIMQGIGEGASTLNALRVVHRYRNGELQLDANSGRQLAHAIETLEKSGAWNPAAEARAYRYAVDKGWIQRSTKGDLLALMGGDAEIIARANPAPDATGSAMENARVMQEATTAVARGDVGAVPEYKGPFAEYEKLDFDLLMRIYDDPAQAAWAEQLMQNLGLPRDQIRAVVSSDLRPYAERAYAAGRISADELELFQRTKDVQELKGRTFEEVHARIPDVEKQIAKDARRTVEGKPFSALDLEQRGPGFLPTREADEATLHAELVSVMDKAAEDAGLPAELRAKVKVPPIAKWNDAFSLPARARYWYELSAEGFVKDYLALPQHMIRRFIDIVAGTSGSEKPLPNLEIAIAVMSQEARGLPVTVGVRDRASVTRAMSPEDFRTLKYGNFARTMQNLAELRHEYPLATIDRQMAAFFGLKEGDVASNPVMYETLVRFLNKVRDMQNARLPEGSQPYEAWQVQALAWVEQRKAQAKAGKASEDPGDYGAEMPKVIRDLKDAGIPLDHGKIGMVTLLDPKTVDVLAPSARLIAEGPIATVETATKLTATGKAAYDLRKVLSDVDAPWARNARDEYEQILRDSMKAIGERKTVKVDGKDKKLPSLISELASAIRGKTFEVSRIETDGVGTFEGEANPNIRIPLAGKSGREPLTGEEARVFLAVLGKHFKQAAQAWAEFKSVEIGQHDTFSIFIERFDNAPLDEKLMADVSAAIGRPVNGSRVANGWVIDINVGGFDPVTDFAGLHAALDPILGTHTWDAIPRKYRSDYMESDAYDGVLRRFKRAVQKNADAKRSRGAWDTEQRVRVLDSVEGSLKRIAKEQEVSLRAWVDQYGTRAKKEGIPGSEALAQEASGTIKASIEFASGEDGPIAALVRFFTRKDISSMAHEIAGHGSRRFLLNRDVPLEKRLGVTDEMIDAVEGWLGVKDGVWLRSHEEAYARAWEKYFYDGKAPTQKLQPFFDKIANWLRGIYQSLKGSEIDIEIPDEVRAVFDRIIQRGEGVAEPDADFGPAIRAKDAGPAGQADAELQARAKQQIDQGWKAQEEKPKFARKMYRGEGASLEDIYGKANVERGTAVPLFGPGKYYAFKEGDAALYGTVSTADVALKNPYMLDSDAKWFELLRAADTPHLNNMSELHYSHPEGVAPDTVKLQRYLQDQGYDGIVVKLSLQDDTTKRLNAMVDHDQVVAFEQPAKAKGQAASGPSKAAGAPEVDPAVQRALEQYGDRVVTEDGRTLNEVMADVDDERIALAAVRNCMIGA